MRRITAAVAATAISVVTLAGPALGCGGLIGPNGAVNLLRTTTFAGYHDGVEHYVTAFEYAGGGGEFGSIIPLPDEPTSVEKGGDWTLQRLLLETDPVVQLASAEADTVGRASDVEVILETRIDALDITVLKGGGEDVAAWAEEHGFELSPDASEVLAFYSARSPYFLAAVFDGAAASERGQQVGDGTPVHITIPTDDPWVPLRILSMGKPTDEIVQADVFLLTDRKPDMLPRIRLASTSDEAGLSLDHSAPASDALLDDLRSDRGMEWVPGRAWLTKVRIEVAAGDLLHDLAVDASGSGTPSAVAAGLEPVAG